MATCGSHAYNSSLMDCPTKGKEVDTQDKGGEQKCGCAFVRKILLSKKGSGKNDMFNMRSMRSK